MILKGICPTSNNPGGGILRCQSASNFEVVRNTTTGNRLTVPDLVSCGLITKYFHFISLVKLKDNLKVEQTSCIHTNY